jgi:hypothetical protein
VTHPTNHQAQFFLKTTAETSVTPPTAIPALGLRAANTPSVITGDNIANPLGGFSCGPTWGASIRRDPLRRSSRRRAKRSARCILSHSFFRSGSLYGTESPLGLAVGESQPQRTLFLGFLHCGDNLPVCIYTNVRMQSFFNGVLSDAPPSQLTL